MNELYVLALMRSAGFPMEREYEQSLHALFLRDGENDDLLYLESETDPKLALLYLLARIPTEADRAATFGRCLMTALMPFYRSQSLTEFTAGLRRMWRLLPSELSFENPFHMFCYADDPLSWGDEAQCRELCERILHFYRGPICDLHVHSSCSDGSFSPEELIAEAKREGVAAVALCDHNTLAGLGRFEKAARKTDILAVPGVEITAGVTVGNGEEREVHILGLFIPRRARRSLAELLSVIDHRKRESNRETVDRLAEAGYAIDRDAVRAAAGEATPNRVHIARVLMERGYVGSVKEAFDTLLRDGGGFYRAPARLDALEVIECLHERGAVPVWAHPLLTLSREEIRALLPIAREHGLAGVETVYPLYSEEDAAFMAEIAAHTGLLPSGGSDFHGVNKPDTRMGCGKDNICVPFEIYLRLKERSAHPINQNKKEYPL